MYTQPTDPIKLFELQPIQKDGQFGGSIREAHGWIIAAYGTDNMLKWTTFTHEEASLADTLTEVFIAHPEAMMIVSMVTSEPTGTFVVDERTSPEMREYLLEVILSEQEDNGDPQEHALYPIIDALNEAENRTAIELSAP